MHMTSIPVEMHSRRAPKLSAWGETPAPKPLLLPLLLLLPSFVSRVDAGR
jgi:hypothetical protein